jgi:hypothetical protein
LSFTVQEATKVLSQKFLLQEGVAGISHHSRELIVYVESEDVASKIPQTLMGYPAKTVVSGKFRTLSLPSAKTGRTLAGLLGARTERWRPCITKDSIILANPSPKTLEELKEGEYVYSLDDSHRLVKRRLVKKICSGVKPVYRLKTYGHEIEATEDHPFLVYSGRKWWYERDKKGQYDGRRSAVYFEWKPLRALKPGDLIATFRDLHNGQIRLKRGNIAFTRVKSIEFAGEREVWDLEIEGTHNFIANGLVVHNCPGGVSIGSVKITAGTNAGRVYDLATGQKMFLSARHVFWGEKGTPIVSPGKYDGGSDPDDRVATIERWVELKPPPDTNLVDAALGLPTSQEIVSDEVLDIGLVNAIEDAKVGTRVAKSGRSSNYAEATITDVNASVKVGGYDWGETVFEDQIITDYLGAPGDSGSCVVNVATKNAVGLLFAGSNRLTVLNKMTNIVKLLNVDITRAATAMPPIRAPLSYVQLPFAFGLLLLMGSRKG